jgi:hypothetical protein
MSKKIDWKKRAQELEQEVRRVRAYAFDYGNATGECEAGYLQQRGLICHKCRHDNSVDRSGCPFAKKKQ